jgi:DNA-binding response OmpR family regulator
MDASDLQPAPGARVLLVEDDERLAELISEYLGRNGLDLHWIRRGDGAVEKTHEIAPDLLLLDVMLPGLDGFAVCRGLRQRGIGVPILMLTARTQVPDRVAGLDAGADDYLSKPFSFDELLARLRALHRRATPGDTAALHAGDLRLDLGARRVFRGDTPIDLSAREFDILALLMARAGQCVTRYQILDEVWDGETDLRSNVIDVHVATLRAKVDKPFGRAAIQTLRGAGYRLDPDGG